MPVVPLLGGVLIGVTGAMLGETSPFDPTAALLNYGVLGVMFLLVLFGRLITMGQYAREREISDAVLANNTKLADAAERMADAWESQARLHAADRG